MKGEILTLCSLDQSQPYNVYSLDQSQPYAHCIISMLVISFFQRFAESLVGDARAGGIQAVLLDLRDCDPEESLTQEVGLGCCATTMRLQL